MVRLLPRVHISQGKRAAKPLVSPETVTTSDNRFAIKNCLLIMDGVVTDIHLVKAKILQNEEGNFEYIVGLMVKADGKFRPEFPDRRSRTPKRSQFRAFDIHFQEMEAGDFALRYELVQGPKWNRRATRVETGRVITKSHGGAVEVSVGEPIGQSFDGTIRILGSVKFDNFKMILNRVESINFSIRTDGLGKY